VASRDHPPAMWIHGNCTDSALVSGCIATQYPDERAAGRMQDGLHGTKPGSRRDSGCGLNETIDIGGNAAAQPAEQLSRKLHGGQEQPLRVHLERTLHETYDVALAEVVEIEDQRGQAMLLESRLQPCRVGQSPRQLIAATGSGEMVREPLPGVVVRQIWGVWPGIDQASMHLRRRSLEESRQVISHHIVDTNRPAIGADTPAVSEPPPQ